MHVDLAVGDGVPIYQQIANQIIGQVASGRLTPGEEVPPIRALAEQLVVNPNTVARAYRELERAGVLTTRRTAGTFVAEGASAPARRTALALLEGRVQALVREARRLTLGADEVVELVRQRYAEEEA